MNAETAVKVLDYNELRRQNHAASIKDRRRMSQLGRAENNVGCFSRSLELKIKIGHFVVSRSVKKI